MARFILWFAIFFLVGKVSEVGVIFLFKDHIQQIGPAALMLSASAVCWVFMAVALSCLYLKGNLAQSEQSSNESHLLSWLGFQRDGLSISNFVQTTLAAALCFGAAAAISILLDAPRIEIPATVVPIIMVTIGLPFLEEVIFRGFFQTKIADSTRGKATAILTTALLFIAMHTQYDLKLMATIVPISLGLSFIRYRTDNLWLCIWMHAIYNAAVFAI